MDDGMRAIAAHELFDAYASRIPVEPLSSAFPDLTLDDAYAIQLLQIADRVAAGRRVIGHKVGLTLRRRCNDSWACRSRTTAT